MVSCRWTTYSTGPDFGTGLGGMRLEKPGTRIEGTMAESYYGASDRRMYAYSRGQERKSC